MEEINLVVNNKLRPWQYVAKDIISALSGVEEASASALEAAVSAINSTLASTTTYGLTKITDSTSTTELEAGVAASPKAVYDALQAAYSYADSQLAAGIAGAYKYKGSVSSVSALAAIQSPQAGDIYNVQGTVNGEDDGVNYAYVEAVGTSGEPGYVAAHWDSLGGILKVETVITEGDGGNSDSAYPPSISAVVSFVNSKISDVNGDLSEIQSTISAIQSTIDNDSTETPGLTQLIAANASAIEANASAIEANASDISALQGSVSDIESAIDNDSTETPGLTQRIEAVEAAIDTSDTTAAGYPGLTQRIEALESGAPTSVTAETKTSGSTVTVTKNSDAVEIINTNGTFTLAFTAGGATDYATKEILLHAQTDTTLTVTGATFANAMEDPDWGKAGYELYLRVTFINAEVIITILSNSQEAYNTTQYTTGA